VISKVYACEEDSLFIALENLKKQIYADFDRVDFLIISVWSHIRSLGF